VLGTAIVYDVTEVVEPSIHVMAKITNSVLASHHGGADLLILFRLTS
jgi:hypothetical protein